VSEHCTVLHKSTDDHGKANQGAAAPAWLHLTPRQARERAADAARLSFQSQYARVSDFAGTGTSRFLFTTRPRYPRRTRIEEESLASANTVVLTGRASQPRAGSISSAKAGSDHWGSLIPWSSPPRRPSPATRARCTTFTTRPAVPRPQRRPGPFGDRPIRARVRLVLCKQNIDDLHGRDGSRRITHVHVHGRLLTARCVASTGVTR
jgi:hypothetical protein